MPGQTGDVSAPQLHFEIRHGTTAGQSDSRCWWRGISLDLSFLPSSPARSWMNCQATRPERPPRPRRPGNAPARAMSSALDLQSEMRRHRLRPSPDIRPGCNCGSPATVRSGRTARPFPPPLRDGIDRGGALILHHVARHQMAAVRGGIEQHIAGPALDAAFQRRLQRFVAGVVLVEGKIVAEEQEAPLRRRAEGAAAAAGWRCPRDGFRSATRRALPARLLISRMHGLDQRAFAHAARAPEQRIVGRQAVGEAARVFQQRVARWLDRP